MGHGDSSGRPGSRSLTCLLSQVLPDSNIDGTDLLRVKPDVDSGKLHLCRNSQDSQLLDYLC